MNARFLWLRVAGATLLALGCHRVLVWLDNCPNQAQTREKLDGARRLRCGIGVLGSGIAVGEARALGHTLARNRPPKTGLFARQLRSTARVLPWRESPASKFTDCGRGA